MRQMVLAGVVYTPGVDGWETVIGLEVHARLQTLSKLFCGCSTTFGAPPNTRVCPVCLGYPGALPTLNAAAVELAVRLALAVGATVHPASVFARKNYFYPDLPKGYQISQYDRPLATGGAVSARSGGAVKTFRITRIHIEEDAGKLIHDSSTDGSLVDLNRAGVPLVEIVSEPEMRSAEDAVAYLTRLRQVLLFTGVSDGNMEEGSLRCDANVSVRRPGSPFGTRAEVKNLNSFRFLSRAIEFESARQAALLSSGDEVIQETRLFDVSSGETRPMRGKEEAHDYRYFDEPDLLRVAVDADLIARQSKLLPALPHERVRAYESDHGVPTADAEVLVSAPELADYFEEVAKGCGNWRAAANWVRNEVMAFGGALADSPVSPKALARIIQLVDSGTISGKAGKEVLEEIATAGGDPEAIVLARGLSQLSDVGLIREEAERVIASNSAQAAQYRAGKKTLFGFFVGQLLKATGGRANPELANRVLRELLDR